MSQLIKRVLGHADGSVTAIYNRYGYVKEMREVLERWNAELTAGEFDAAHVARTGYSSVRDREANGSGVRFLRSCTGRKIVIF